ncbi:MAG: hypothetical protein V2I33_15325 [Kangiellaceae bacterium]|jgi:hypothetical protein|nr:hypothetical protein [Kangiellaceae bacterium]
MVYFLFSVVIVCGLLTLKYYKLKELVLSNELDIADSDEWLTLTSYLSKISKRYLPVYVLILIVIYTGSNLINDNQMTTVLLLSALGYMHFMNVFIMISAVEAVAYEHRNNDRK